jgi:AbrB family looped-hinge helix DNA binding protein
MAIATVSSKNQIVIPREAREALGLRAGDKVLVVARGKNVIVLKKPSSHRAAVRGIASQGVSIPTSSQGTAELEVNCLRLLPDVT